MGVLKRHVFPARPNNYYKGVSICGNSMAKKRRLIKEEPEEEYTFNPSDFDEREFLLKGIYSTKVLILAIILAIASSSSTISILNISPDPSLYNTLFTKLSIS